MRGSGHEVCLDARDLGGRVHFSMRATNFTLTARFEKLQSLWPRLRASFSSYKHKRAALPVAAWPKSLHGVAGVALGDQHFARLRAGAMAGLHLDRPGASPLIHLSLMSFPLTDPGFFAVRVTVLEFRHTAHRELVAPVVAAALSMPGRRHVGPVGVLLERVARLSWTWDLARQCFVDSFGPICLWHASPQELDFRLAFGWQMYVAGQVQTRKGFGSLQDVDFAHTMQLLRVRPAEDQALLHVALGGAFFTADKLCKFEEGGLPMCRFCGQADSIEHRVWQCPGLEAVRQAVTPRHFPGFGTLPECQRLHAWTMRPAGQLELLSLLASLPDTTWNFQPWPSAASFDLFVDGSCHMPASPRLRLATWAVVIARHAVDDPPVILNAGLLPGILQTSFRAEIFGLLAACRFCRVTGATVRVWCDCLGVVRKGQGLLAGTWTVKHNTKNADLWRLVYDEVSVVWEKLDIQKVSAHESSCDDHDCVMDWLVLNKGDADNAARQAQALRSQAFWDVWHGVRRDLAFQTMVGNVVLDVHAAVARVASRRQEPALVSTPVLWQPTEAHRLELGSIPVRGAMQYARKFGAVFWRFLNRGAGVWYRPRQDRAALYAGFLCCSWSLPMFSQSDGGLCFTMVPARRGMSQTVVYVDSLFRPARPRLFTGLVWPCVLLFGLQVVATFHVTRDRIRARCKSNCEWWLFLGALLWPTGLRAFLQPPFLVVCAVDVRDLGRALGCCLPEHQTPSALSRWSLPHGKWKVVWGSYFTGVWS